MKSPQVLFLPAKDGIKLVMPCQREMYTKNGLVIKPFILSILAKDYSNDCPVLEVRSGKKYIQFSESRGHTSKYNPENIPEPWLKHYKYLISRANGALAKKFVFT